MAKGIEWFNTCLTYIIFKKKNLTKWRFPKMGVSQNHGVSILNVYNVGWFRAPKYGKPPSICPNIPLDGSPLGPKPCRQFCASGRHATVRAWGCCVEWGTTGATKWLGRFIELLKPSISMFEICKIEKLSHDVLNCLLSINPYGIGLMIRATPKKVWWVPGERLWTGRFHFPIIIWVCPEVWQSQNLPFQHISTRKMMIRD